MEDVYKRQVVTIANLKVNIYEFSTLESVNKSLKFINPIKSKSPNPLKLVKLYITPFNNGNV